MHTYIVPWVADIVKNVKVFESWMLAKSKLSTLHEGIKSTQN